LRGIRHLQLPVDIARRPGHPYGVRAVDLADGINKFADILASHGGSTRLRPGGAATISRTLHQFCAKRIVPRRQDIAWKTAALDQN
jgi:hypothetical protein